MNLHDEQKPNRSKKERWQQTVAELGDLCYVVGVRTVRCLKTLDRFTRRLWQPFWRSVCRGFLRGKEFVTAQRYKRLRVHLVNGLSPVVAAIILFSTIGYWQQAEYALALEYQDGTVGYIANESIYANAALQAKKSVINADGSFVVETSPNMLISVVENQSLLSSEEVCKQILKDSADVLANAAGLYIGGEFCGALATSEAVRAAMNAVLDPHLTEEYDGVDFLNEWKITEGVYPVSAVVTATELCKTLEKFPVKTYKTITYKEIVKYSTVRVVDTDQPLGYESVTTKGKDGLQEVQAQIVYVDGEERYRTVTATKILKAPRNQVKVVGAQTYTDTSIIGDGKATGTFVWPLPYTKRISSYFASRWGRFHGAIDIADGRTHGKPIIASDGGTVVEAKMHSSYGLNILIDHGNGFMTRYAHCSVLEVKEGDKVAQGQYIAKVGDTGYVTGSHLHFEVIKLITQEDGSVERVLVNPLDYVQR